MSEKIITNIALDTSFIEAQNFLAGKLLYDLGDLGEKKYAAIYLTDIVYREVLARFAKRVFDEKAKIKQVKDTIASSIRVLKNFDDYKSFFTLPTLNIDQVTKEFKQKFDGWISKANINIINTDGITIGKIFNDYFNNNPPFSKVEKKHEFPDAFSFLALEDYFDKIQRECLFVTQDKDFDGMTGGYVIAIKEISPEIDKILRHEKLSDTFKLIEKGFDENKTKLEKEAKDIVSNFIIKEVSSTSEIRGMWIDSLKKVDLSDIEFAGYKIVFIGEGQARLEVYGNFAYQLTLAVEDNSEAIYDREDGVYYGTQYRSIVIKDNKEERFSVIADFDLEEEYVEIAVDDVNDGNGFQIFDHTADH